MSESGLNRAYLSLGSNIRPHENLPAAVRGLRNFGRVAAVSRVWETQPVGYRDQPNFLNAAVLLETRLSAVEVREQAIVDIERQLHRVRDPDNVNGPRTIDVDLLLFNADVLQLGARDVPDPEILSRPFLAIPLAELDPDYVHPQVGKTLQEIAGRFRDEWATMKVRSDIDLSAAASQALPEA